MRKKKKINETENGQCRAKNRALIKIGPAKCLELCAALRQVVHRFVELKSAVITNLCTKRAA